MASSTRWETTWSAEVSTRQGKAKSLVVTMNSNVWTEEIFSSSSNMVINLAFTVLCRPLLGLYSLMICLVLLIYTVLNVGIEGLHSLTCSFFSSTKPIIKLVSGISILWFLIVSTFSCGSLYVKALHLTLLMKYFSHTLYIHLW